MPLALLDRDGTLNREQSFIASPDQLVLLPRVAEALRRLVDRGYRPVVVTSQSGIARGLYDQTTLARIHDTLQTACDGLLQGFFHCPHHPDMPGPYGGPCNCRKPHPALVQRAAHVLGEPLEGSVLIGDSARDLLMAEDVPMDTILVRSGKPWRKELAALTAKDATPDHVADDLWDAVDWLLQDR